MRGLLITTGLLAALLAPSAAFAQWADPGCVRSNHDSRVEGTVLGAIGGGLLGDLAGGRHSHGAGTALGALGGAVAGNAIAGSRNDPCPSYAPPPPPYGAAPGYYGPPPPPPPGDGGLNHWLDSLHGRVAGDRSAGFLTNHQVRSLDSQLGQLHQSVGQLVWQDG